jgi:hypothetical protein
MNCKIICLLLIGGLFCGLTAWADDEICPYHKLKWDDFKGPMPGGTDLDSETDCGFQNSAYTVQTEPKAGGGFKAKSKDIKITAYMNKSTSWVRPGIPGGASSAALLEHEQYHMDIAEYWAKEVQKRVDKLEGEGATAQAATDDYKAKLKKTLDDAKKECDAMQKKYDDETKHGTDSAEQAKWCKTVGQLLACAPVNRDKAFCMNGHLQFQPGVGLFVADSFFDVFYQVELPFNDPIMQGGRLHLPPLQYTGPHMNQYGQPLWKFEATPMAGFFQMYANNNALAASGELLLLMSHGNQMTGWLEAVDVQPNVTDFSPYFHNVEQTRNTGKALMTITINTPMPIEVATQNFTRPANMPCQIVVGTNYVPLSLGIPMQR